MSARFGSVITAMATPFKDDLTLDLDRAQELAAWLLDHGSDGLVIAGSTGEGATLSDQEKVDLWRAVAQAVGDRAAVAKSAVASFTPTMFSTSCARVSSVSGSITHAVRLGML